MYLISAEDFRQKEAYRIVPLYAVVYGNKMTVFGQ